MATCQARLLQLGDCQNPYFTPILSPFCMDLLHLQSTYDIVNMLNINFWDRIWTRQIESCSELVLKVWGVVTSYYIRPSKSRDCQSWIRWQYQPDIATWAIVGRSSTLEVWCDMMSSPHAFKYHFWARLDKTRSYPVSKVGVGMSLFICMDFKWKKGPPQVGINTHLSGEVGDNL